MLDVLTTENAQIHSNGDFQLKRTNKKLCQFLIY